MGALFAFAIAGLPFGKRVNAVMYGMAKDLTDEEIRILAAHYGK